MTEILIRKIKNEDQYLAILSSKLNSGCFFATFSDNIFGLVTLIRFMEMIKKTSDNIDLELKIIDKEIQIKDRALYEYIIESKVKNKEALKKQV